MKPDKKQNEYIVCPCQYKLFEKWKNYRPFLIMGESYKYFDLYFHETWEKESSKFRFYLPLKKGEITRIRLFGFNRIAENIHKFVNYWMNQDCKAYVNDKIVKKEIYEGK